MYRSPIDVIYGKIQKQIEGDIFRAVQSYDINVDKAELLRALQYDRNQYDKGYADGKADAMAELVCCKDCKHLEITGCYGECGKLVRIVKPWDFCSYGERKAEE